MSVDFSVANLNLNVANGAAAVILFDLLGFGREEFDGPWGTLDAADVLRRLAVAEVRIPGLVTPTRETRGTYIGSDGVGPGALVIECGFDTARLTRYTTALRAMAEKAIAIGETISFG